MSLNPVVELRNSFEGLPTAVRRPIEMVVFGGELPRADISGMRQMAAEFRAKAAELSHHSEDANDLLAQENSVGVLGDRLRETLRVDRDGAARLGDDALALADQAQAAAGDAEKTLCVMFVFGIELAWRIFGVLSGAAAAGPAGEMAAVPVVESMLVEGRGRVAVMRAGLEQAFKEGATRTAIRRSALGSLRLPITLGRAAALPVSVDAGVQALQVVSGDRTPRVIGPDGANPTGIDPTSIKVAALAGAGGALGGTVAGRVAAKVIPRIEGSRLALGLVHGTAGAAAGLGAATLVTGWPQHFDQVLAPLLNGGFAGVVHAHAPAHPGSGSVIDGGGAFTRPDLPAAVRGESPALPPVEVSAASKQAWEAAKSAWAAAADTAAAGNGRVEVPAAGAHENTAPVISGESRPPAASGSTPRTDSPSRTDLTPPSEATGRAAARTDSAAGPAGRAETGAPVERPQPGESPARANTTAARPVTASGETSATPKVPASALGGRPGTGPDTPAAGEHRAPGNHEHGDQNSAETHKTPADARPAADTGDGPETPAADEHRLPGNAGHDPVAESGNPAHATSDPMQADATAESGDTSGPPSARDQAVDLLTDFHASSGDQVPEQLRLYNLSDEVLKAGLFDDTDPRASMLATAEIIRRGTISDAMPGGMVLRTEQAEGMYALNKRPVEMKPGEGKSLMFMAAAMQRAVRHGECLLVTTTDGLAHREFTRYRKLLTDYGIDVIRADQQQGFGPVTEGRPAIVVATGETVGHLCNAGHQPPRHALIDEMDGIIDRGERQFLRSEGVEEAAHEATASEVFAAHDFLADALAKGALSHADFGLTRIVDEVGLHPDGTPEVEYWYDGQAQLTPTGRAKVEALPGGEQWLEGMGSSRLEMAAAAEFSCRAKTHYVMDAGKVVIVDQSEHGLQRNPQTSSESRWSAETGKASLAQAVEAKEIRAAEARGMSAEQHQIVVRADAEDTKSITAVEIYRQGGRFFDEVTGASGTLADLNPVLDKIYGLKEAHQVDRSQEQRLMEGAPDVAANTRAKLGAIAEGAHRVWQGGRGRAQEILCHRNDLVERQVQALVRQGVPREAIEAVDADRIASWGAEWETELQQVFDTAGEQGKILVINRQGQRGVDIAVSEAVQAKGGMFVWMTEVPEQSYIYEQGKNRTARNGDRGSAQALMAPQDALIRKAMHLQGVRQAAVRYDQAADAHRTDPTPENHNNLVEASDNLSSLVPELQQRALRHATADFIRHHAYITNDPAAVRAAAETGRYQGFSETGPGIADIGQPGVADIGQPDRTEDGAARLAGLLGIPAAAVAGNAAALEQDGVEDPLGRLLEQTGLPPAAVAALRQQVEATAPATVAQYAWLDDEQAMDQLVPKRDQLARELGFDTGDIDGAEGMRKLDPALTDATNNLAQALGYPLSSITPAIARDILGEVVDHQMPAEGAHTPAARDDALGDEAGPNSVHPVSVSPEAEDVIAAASHYLATAALLDLAVAIHRRSPNSCVNNAVTGMRVLTGRRIEMPATAMAGHSRAVVADVFGAPLENAGSLDDVAESLKTRPGGIAVLVYKCKNTEKQRGTAANGRNDADNHMVLLVNDSEPGEPPKLVVVDLAADRDGGTDTDYGPKDLQNRRTLLNKAVPFETWRQKQRKFIKNVPTDKRLFETIDFDRDGNLIARSHRDVLAAETVEVDAETVREINSIQLDWSVNVDGTPDLPSRTDADIPDKADIYRSAEPARTGHRPHDSPAEPETGQEPETADRALAQSMKADTGDAPGDRIGSRPHEGTADSKPTGDAPGDPEGPWREFAAAIPKLVTADARRWAAQGNSPDFRWLASQLGPLARHFSTVGDVALRLDSDEPFADFLPLWNRFSELTAEFEHQGFGIWYERTMRQLLEWMVECAPVGKYRNSYEAVEGVNDTGAYVGISSEVNRGGIMRSIIVAAQGTPRGGVMFADGWDAVGDIVHGIGGVWVQNNKMLGDNLHTFNAGIREKLSPEDAARATFTGKMACRRGFTEVVIDHTAGDPGNYNTALVTFVRPSRSREMRCRALGRLMGVSLPEVLDRAGWSSEIARLHEAALESAELSRTAFRPGATEVPADGSQVETQIAKVERLAEWVAQWWAEQDARDHSAVATVAADVVRRNPGARQVTPNTVLLPGHTIVVIAEDGLHDDAVTDMMLHNLELRAELRSAGYALRKLKPVVEQDDSSNTRVWSADLGTVHINAKRATPDDQDLARSRRDEQVRSEFQSVITDGANRDTSSAAYLRTDWPQRAALVRQRHDLTSQLPGIPARWRNRACRYRLAQEVARLRDSRENLDEAARRRLAYLETIGAVLARADERAGRMSGQPEVYLWAFDPDTGYLVFTVGDPDLVPDVDDITDRHIVDSGTADLLGADVDRVVDELSSDRQFGPRHRRAVVIFVSSETDSDAEHRRRADLTDITATRAFYQDRVADSATEGSALVRLLEGDRRDTVSEMLWLVEHLMPDHPVHVVGATAGPDFPFGTPGEEFAARVGADWSAVFRRPEDAATHLAGRPGTFALLAVENPARDYSSGVDLVMVRNDGDDRIVQIDLNQVNPHSVEPGATARAARTRDWPPFDPSGWVGKWDKGFGIVLGPDGPERPLVDGESAGVRGEDFPDGLIGARPTEGGSGSAYERYRQRTRQYQAHGPLHDRHRMMLADHLAAAVYEIDDHTARFLAAAVQGVVTDRIVSGRSADNALLGSADVDPDPIAALPDFAPMVTTAVHGLLAEFGETTPSRDGRPDPSSGLIGSRPFEEPDSQRGAWLKARRLELEMTQVQLAQATGVAMRVLSGIETGKREPTLGIFQRICRALGLEGAALSEAVRQFYSDRERDHDPVAHDPGSPGSWVMALCFAQGASLDELAPRANVPTADITGIERGTRPDSIIFRRICRALGVTPDVLEAATGHFYPDLVLDLDPAAHDRWTPGGWFVALRHDLDLTRTELQTAIGPGWGDLYDIETNIYRPKYAAFRQICDVLGVGDELLHAANRQFYSDIDLDPEPAAHDLGRWITNRRNVRGMSRAELAQVTGLSGLYLTEVETKNRRPPSGAFLRICRALGLEGAASTEAVRQFYSDMNLHSDAAEHDSLADWVVALRNNKGMTEADLASAVHVSPRQIERIENGDRPSLGLLLRIDDVLGVGRQEFAAAARTFYSDLEFDLDPAAHDPGLPGSWLTALCVDRGVGLVELARTVGVTAGVMTGIEGGTRPDSIIFRRIWRALEVAPEVGEAATGRFYSDLILDLDPLAHTRWNPGTWIVALRHHVDLVRVELAEATELGSSRLSAIESGDRPSHALFRRICDALGVDDELLQAAARRFYSDTDRRASVNRNPASYESLGRWIAARRHRQGMSVEELARRAQMPEHSIVDIENHGHLAPLVELREICSVLSVDGAVLLKAIDAFYADGQERSGYRDEEELFAQYVVSRVHSPEERNIRNEICARFAWVPNALARRVPPEIRGDAVRAAWAGILSAIDNHVPSASFVPHAWTNGSRAILRYRVARELPDLDNRTLNKIIAVSVRIGRMATAGEVLDDAEIARAMGSTVADVMLAREILSRPTLQPDAPITGRDRSGNRELGDSAASTGFPDTDFAVTVRAALADMPDAGIAEQLMMLHLVEGTPLVGAAEQLGLPAADAAQVLADCVARLRNAFDERGGQGGLIGSRPREQADTQHDVAPGAWIKALRLERGMTQKQLAQALGVTISALSGIEIGTRRPRIGTFQKICRALGLTEEALTEAVRRFYPDVELETAVAAHDSVGGWVVALRNSKGMTTVAFAGAVGMGRSRIEDFDRGERPRPGLFLRFARVLEVGPESLAEAARKFYPDVEFDLDPAAHDPAAPGRWIAALLDDRDMSQVDLALTAGVSAEYLSKIVGGVYPTRALFQRICLALGVVPEVLEAAIRRFYPDPDPGVDVDVASYESPGRWIAAVRHSRGMSVAELTRRSRVAGSSISALEKGARLPRWKTFRQLCRALGVGDELLLEALDRFYAGSYPRSGNRDEEELFKRYVVSGIGSPEERAIRGEICDIIGWIPDAVARYVAPNLRDETVQDAWMGILGAIDNHVPSSSFTAHAWASGCAAVRKYRLARQLPDIDSRTLRKVIAVRAHIGRMVSAGEVLDDREIARAASITVADVVLVREILARPTVQLDAPITGKDGSWTRELTDPAASAGFSHADFAVAVRAALADMSDPGVAERLVMMHLMEGMPLADAAERLELQAADAAVVLADCVARLRNAFDEHRPSGVTTSKQGPAPLTRRTTTRAEPDQPPARSSDSEPGEGSPKPGGRIGNRTAADEGGPRGLIGSRPFEDSPGERAFAGPGFEELVQAGLDSGIAERFVAEEAPGVKVEEVTFDNGLRVFMETYVDPIDALVQVLQTEVAAIVGAPVAHAMLHLEDDRIYRELTPGQPGDSVDVVDPEVLGSPSATMLGLFDAVTRTHRTAREWSVADNAVMGGRSRSDVDATPGGVFASSFVWRVDGREVWLDHAMPTWDVAAIREAVAYLEAWISNFPMLEEHREVLLDIHGRYMAALAQVEQHAVLTSGEIAHRAGLDAQARAKARLVETFNLKYPHVAMVGFDHPDVPAHVVEEILGGLAEMFTRFPDRTNIRELRIDYTDSETTSARTHYGPGRTPTMQFSLRDAARSAQAVRRGIRFLEFGLNPVGDRPFHYDAVHQFVHAIDAVEGLSKNLQQVLSQTHSELSRLGLIDEHWWTWFARLPEYAFGNETKAVLNDVEALAVGFAEADIHGAAVGTPQWAIHEYVTTGRPPRVTPDLEVDLPAHGDPDSNGSGGLIGSRPHENDSQSNGEWGAWIKALRLERAMTREQLAQAVGLTKSALSGFETGKRKPPLGTFQRICRALELAGEVLTEAVRRFYPDVELETDVAAHDSPGRWIAARRNTKGMNKSGLARAVGVDPTSIGDIERGEHPRPGLFLRIARVLGVGQQELAEAARKFYPDVEFDLDPSAYDPGSRGSWIAALRHDRDMFQTELARAAGISGAYVSKIESGEYIPRPLVFRRMCRALRVAPEVLEVATGHFYPDLELDLDPTAYDPGSPGSWFVALRHDRDLTQEEVVKATGSSVGHLSNVESGKSVGIAVFRRICDALGVGDELRRAAARHFYPDINVDIDPASHDSPGRWIAALRNDQGMSGVELARRSRMPKGSISSIENQQFLLRLGKLRQLCGALAVGGDVLLEAVERFYSDRFERSGDRDEEALFNRYVVSRVGSSAEREIRDEICARFAWVPNALARRESPEIRDEAVQAAWMGILSAIDNHVPSSSFAAHAWASGRGAILTYRLARRFPDLDNRTRWIVRRVEAQIGRMVSAGQVVEDAEIARAVRLTVADVVLAREILARPIVQLDAHVRGTEGPLHRGLADPAAATGFSDTDFVMAVRAALADMADSGPAERLVMLHLVDGVPLADVAVQLRLPSARVAEVLTDSVARLRNAFDERRSSGVTTSKQDPAPLTPWTTTRAEPDQPPARSSDSEPGEGGLIGSRPHEHGETPQRPTPGQTTPWSREVIDEPHPDHQLREHPSHTIPERPADHTPGPIPLTPRETEVLARVRQGMTHSEIAAALDLSVLDVRANLTSVRRKLRNERARLVAASRPADPPSTTSEFDRFRAAMYAALMSADQPDPRQLLAEASPEQMGSAVQGLSSAHRGALRQLRAGAGTPVIRSMALIAARRWVTTLAAEHNRSMALLATALAEASPADLQTALDQLTAAERQLLVNRFGPATSPATFEPDDSVRRLRAVDIVRHVAARFATRAGMSTVGESDFDKSGFQRGQHLVESERLAAAQHANSAAAQTYAANDCLDAVLEWMDRQDPPESGKRSRGSRRGSSSATADRPDGRLQQDGPPADEPGGGDPITQAGAHPATSGPDQPRRPGDNNDTGFTRADVAPAYRWRSLPVDHGFDDEQQRLADEALHAGGFGDADMLQRSRDRLFAASAQRRATENGQWWNSLSDPAEPGELSTSQQALIQVYPHQIGNADGLPATIRDHANRLSISRDLDEFIARKPADQRLLNWLRNLTDAERKQFRNLICTRNHLQELDRQAAEIPGSPPVHLLYYDPTAFDGKGKVVVALGNVDTAHTVNWHVPGTNTTSSSLAYQFKPLRNLYEETLRVDPSLELASIIWIGYDAPAGPVNTGYAKAAFRRRARVGGRRLLCDIAAFHATRSLAGTAAPDRLAIRIYGHSYGSVTMFYAGRYGGFAGLVRSAIASGSPGAASVGHAAELGIGADNVYVAASWRDLVTMLGADAPGAWSRFNPRLGLGIDPATEAFGGKRIGAEFPDSPNFAGVEAVHQGYLHRDPATGLPTEALANVAQITAGRGDTLASVARRRTGRGVVARPIDSERGRYADGNGNRDLDSEERAERVLRAHWGPEATPADLVYRWQRRSAAKHAVAAEACAAHAARNERIARTLSVDDLEALVRVWPEFVGKAGGFPRDVRDQANRRVFAKARAALEDAAATTMPTRRERRLREYLLNVEDLLIRAGHLAAAVQTPGVPAPTVLLESFDADDPSGGSIIISFGSGDPVAEAWHVDGSDRNLRRLDQRMQLACNHYEVAVRENPERSVRVVVWSGTDGHRLAGDMAALCGDVVTGARLRPERQLVVHGDGGRSAKKALAHESVTHTVGTVVVCGESNLETMGDVLRDVAASVDVYYGVAARTNSPARSMELPGVQFSCRFPSGGASHTVALLTQARAVAQRVERAPFAAGKTIDDEFLRYVDDRVKASTDSLDNMGRILAGRLDRLVTYDDSNNEPVRFADYLRRERTESAYDDVLPHDPNSGNPTLRVTDADHVLARTAIDKRGGRGTEPSALWHRGLPDDFTRAAQLAVDNRRWWNRLSSDERRAVVAVHPKILGNAPGIPSEAADNANDCWRFATSSAIHAKGSKNASRSERQVFRNLYAVDEALTRSVTVHRDIPAPIVSTVGLGPETFGGNGSGTIVIGNCRLEDAEHVVWYVDGVNTRLQSAPSRVANARNLYEELVRADRSRKVAVVCWMGYEAPANNKDAWAARPELAEAGGRLFARDVLALRAVSKAKFSVLASRYGTSTVCDAAVGGRLDGVFEHRVLVGSPGRGRRFDSISDASCLHSWVLALSGDPVTGFGADAPGMRGRSLGDGPLGLGTDPATDTTATRLRAERGFPHLSAPYDGHGEYLDYALGFAAQPSESLRSAAWCLAGRGDELTREPHRPSVDNPTVLHRIRARVVDPVRDRRAPQLDAALAGDHRSPQDLPGPAEKTATDPVDAGRSRPAEPDATAARPSPAAGPRIAVQLGADGLADPSACTDALALGVHAIVVRVGRGAEDVAALDAVCRSAAFEDATLAVEVHAGPRWSDEEVRTKVAEVVTTFAGHGMRGELHAFDQRVLTAAAELAPDCHRVTLINSLTTATSGVRGALGWMARAVRSGADGIDTLLEEARRTGATGLAVPPPLLSEDFVRLAREAEMRLAVWGVAGSGRMRAVLGLGVDEIWTANVEKLALLRAEVAEGGFRIPEPFARSTPFSDWPPKATPWSQHPDRPSRDR